MRCEAPSSVEAYDELEIYLETTQTELREVKRELEQLKSKRTTVSTGAKP